MQKSFQRAFVNYQIVSTILLILISLFLFSADAQGNKKPKIVDQKSLTTNEDQPINILFSHLDVQDSDDWFYPWGFSMKLYPGSNYSIDGNTVIPAPNFNGNLEVEVTVNDGEDDSNKYKLKISVLPVNDKPIITGNSSLSINENESIVIQFSHLTVTDPDNTYPGNFILKFLSGNNYTIEGNKVIPQLNFSGSLSVNLIVNDGLTDSDPYALPIKVIAIIREPEIVKQATLQVNEDESLTILLTHLTLANQDINYPKGFTLTIFPGENYTASNGIVTPVADFSGKLTVPVTVNDGKYTSKPFNLSIAVTPVNDIPKIANLETEPIFYGSGNALIPVSQTITALDVDGDSIMFAEVSIGEGYKNISDRLSYTPPANSKIRGVFDQNSGTLTLLGQASPISYSRALRSVQFHSTETQSAENKIIYFVLNDGKSDSETSKRNILMGAAKVSLEIPTGFTPNGDRANDTWKIVPLKNDSEYLRAQIKVYNKTGSVVFESTGFENEWDGRLNGEMLPADTYFYTIDLNLKTPQGYLKGLVTILR